MVTLISVNNNRAVFSSCGLLSYIIKINFKIHMKKVVLNLAVSLDGFIEGPMEKLIGVLWMMTWASKIFSKVLTLYFMAE